MRAPGLWWRHALLAGLTAGLLTSTLVAEPPGWPVGAALLAGVCVASSRNEAASGWRLLVGVALTAAIAGLGIGEARLDALEPGPIGARAGQRVEVEGFVAAAARRSGGEVRVPIELEEGRVMAVIGEPVAELPIGSRWHLEGTLRAPEDWRREQVERAGAALELRARRAEPTTGARSGLDGVLDRIRSRAEAGLSSGTDPERAALLRGFVLGQDDLVDPVVRERFQRSGLAHLLAVSGQNVMLLAVLVGAILIVVGTGLRTRLLVILAVILIYVPIAGAGASIQRAGVMGAAGIGALLLSRPADRVYLPLLAAAATLALDPRFATDIGWQLSFAAVIGISAWAPRISKLLSSDRARGAAGAPVERLLRGPLAEGAALTLAATVATAPLLAHHFERISIASLPANLMVLPAVAPTMWLGMAAGLAGQVPALPTEPLTWLAGQLVGYIDWVAGATGDPGWAVLETGLAAPASVTLIYVTLALGASILLAAAARRKGLWRVAGPLGLPIALTALLAGVAFAAGGSERDPPTPGALRVTAYDVGQGDATLLEPPGSEPLLVDGGPAGGGVVAQLREDGITELSAVLATHDQSDHVDGLVDVIEQIEVERLLLARPAPSLERVARARRVDVVELGEPRRLRAGRVRLTVLGPRLEAPPATDPNDDSLVLLVELGGYRVLLSGDAESPVLPDTGPIDLLKVAHHGSEDPGLGSLLDRTGPRLAFLSAGRDNRYGHPSAETVAEIETHGICLLRTDTDGEVAIELGPGGIVAEVERPEASAGRPGCAEVAGPSP